jgi:uncharacterized membrane protein
MSNTSELASPEDSQPGTAAADAVQSDAGFRALLTPHRSLGPRGFLMLMLAIGTVSFTTGLVFLMMGAWPVMAFCGLDVALVYLAFKLNYRAARMHESVHLTEAALQVKRVHPNGREESWTFNPYWVRLSVDENEHTERTQLSLRSHGRELVIGHFLSNEEKADFANALSAALQDVRGGAAPT